MFISLDIACEAQGLKTKGSESAYQLLLQAVERYFSRGIEKLDSKVRRTDLPPIYFQHPGHSLTIVGIEGKNDGSKNLLVFDPMFHDNTSITRHIGQVFTYKSPGDLLRAYRRGVKYLRRYNEFEILRLAHPRKSVPNKPSGH